MEEASSAPAFAHVMLVSGARLACPVSQLNCPVALMRQAANRQRCLANSCHLYVWLILVDVITHKQVEIVLNYDKSTPTTRRTQIKLQGRRPDDNRRKHSVKQWRGHYIHSVLYGIFFTSINLIRNWSRGRRCKLNATESDTAFIASIILSAL